MKKILIPTTIAVITAPLISLAGCNKSQEVIPTAITLDKTTATIRAEETLQLNASVEPTDVEVALEWSTSDKTIVDVNETGKIKGIRQGKATITVKVVGYDDLTATCDVTVEKEILEVRLDNDIAKFGTEELELLSTSFNIQLDKHYHVTIDISKAKSYTGLADKLAFAVLIDDGFPPTIYSMVKFDISSFVVDGKTLKRIPARIPDPGETDVFCCEELDDHVVHVEGLLSKALTTTSKIEIDLDFSTFEPTKEKVIFAFLAQR